MKYNNETLVEAIESGSTATSGKIIATKNGKRKEIPAVVFSKSEVNRLFELISTQQPTKAISNSGYKVRLTKLFSKRR